MNLLSASGVSFADSLLVLLIGMLVIFAVLAVLVITVKVYVGILNSFKAKKSEDVKPAVVEQPVQEVVAADDGEVVAAISAAIAMIYASESPTGEVPPFRVKSILLRK